MRVIILPVVLIIILSSHIRAQQKSSGIEIKFSLTHPAKWSLSDYKYSVDPTAEVLYFKSVTSRLSVAGGIMAQTGKHNWMELTGHTFTDKDGIPFPVRTDYSRELEFISLGIPLKLERLCRNCFIHSFFMGITGGKHLKLSLADYLNSVHIADLDPDYNRFFWDLSLGVRKNIYKTQKLKITLSPVAGFRKNSSDKEVGRDNYIFYGLGISTIMGK
jgi:hypothetical protein